MKDDTKIKYTFHNEHGETVDMTFSILEIEGMIGGFMSNVQEALEEMDFGKPVQVFRMLLL